MEQEASNRVSQVFWFLIKNRVSPRSALLKVVYLETLLYTLYRSADYHTDRNFVVFSSQQVLHFDFEVKY